jgi:hypothetical protein
MLKAFLPLADAAIFDGSNHLLGNTDANGYYHISFTYAKTGELSFKLSVRKTGYQTFNQREHWGNLGDKTQAIFYFALRKGINGGKSFSQLVNGDIGADLSYANIAKNFDMVKDRVGFDERLAAIKKGNEDAFVTVDDKYYLASNTSWIQLTSATDDVLIDDKQTVPANKLNGLVKRSAIKHMTPIDTTPPKFAIYTK